MAEITIHYTGPIVTRAEAMAAGLQRYFTASPCKYGHIAQRRIHGWGCLECEDRKKPKKQKTSINKISDVDVSYIAGLIDGEGHLAIAKATSRSCKGGIYYRSRVNIANTNREVLEWVIKVTGIGWIKKTEYIKERNSKTLFTWEIYGENASNFVSMILPYLKIKQKQAQIVISMQKLKAKPWRGFLEKDDLLKREELYHESRELNRRGIVPYIRN